MINAEFSFIFKELALAFKICREGSCCKVPKCKYPLEASEKDLGTWTTNVVIPEIGRYLGDLTVTDKNVIFLSKFDTSLNAIMDKALFRSIDQESYMVLPREEIQRITAKKSLLNKRITLMTKDNNELIIDYGMLSIDPIVKALES